MTTADEKKINAFETKCYRRIVRIPWIAKRKKHSNPKRAKSVLGLVIEQHQSKETIILWPPKKTRLSRKAHNYWRQVLKAKEGKADQQEHGLKTLRSGYR